MSESNKTEFGIVCNPEGGYLKRVELSLILGGMREEAQETDEREILYWQSSGLEANATKAHEVENDLSA